MSDSKLDYYPVRTTTGQKRPFAGPEGFSGALGKLSLPGTGEDFARLEGLDPRDVLSARPMREHDARQTAATAAGVATHDFGAPPIGYYWMVERLAVKGAGIATVYIGQIADYTVKDFTPTAAQDIADESSPIYVPPGVNLIVQYTGAGAGTICTTTVQIYAVPFA